MTDPKASQLRTGNIYSDNTNSYHCVNNIHNVCANNSANNNASYYNSNNNNQLGYDTYVPSYMCNSASTMAKTANNTYTPMPCGPNSDQPIPFMQPSTRLPSSSSSSATTITTMTAGRVAAAPIPFVPCAMSYAVPTPQPMPTVVANNTNNNSICSTNSCTNTNNYYNSQHQGVVHD